MAATVTWEGLRELASFRAEEGCAISLYLDLDPSGAPTAGAVDTRVNALLDEAERAPAASRGDLTHDEKQALQDDLERMRTFFDEEFSREGSRGYALFCHGLGGVWRPLPLSDRVPDLVQAGRTFHLAPLVPLVRRGNGMLVAFVGRERGDLYRLRDGRLEELQERFDEQPGRHDQGGWSQSRFQRHIEKLVHDHLRDVAGLLDQHVRRQREPGLVVVCSEETRPELEEELSKEARSAVVGWTTAEAHSSPSELLQAVKPVLERWRSEQEAAAAERWREEAGRDGRAAAGWAQTLEAASDERVEVLLFQDGADRPAWQCPACGRLAAEDGACPLDGTAMEQNDHGLDLAVHQTLAHGGTVSVLGERRDLDPVEGIGAILRY
jgi:peptide chain release factor subunit 1